MSAMRGHHSQKQVWYGAGSENGITQRDDKGTIPHELASLQHSMSSAQWNALARVEEAHTQVVARYLLHHLRLAFADQLSDQPLIAIEMVFDGALRPAGDEQQLLDASRGQLLYNVLDSGLPPHRQHLLWLRLCRRQEARPHARYEDNRLLDDARSLLCHRALPLSLQVHRTPCTSRFVGRFDHSHAP